ncbi:MAG: cytochrome P450, partial [Dermatophilaceae bacterium]
EDTLRSPYAMHRRLREAGPVVLLTAYDVFALSRFEHVDAALRDHGTFCSSSGVGLADFRREQPWRPPSPLLEADPPDHTIAREAMASVVSFRALRELRPAFQAEADRLVDSLLERRTVDAVTDIAEAYPLSVFPDAVGIRPDGRRHLLPYGDMNFNAFGPPNALQQRSFADADRLHAWMADACRRDQLTPGRLGAQLWSLTDDERITDHQAGLLVRSLLTAGVDTTVCGLGNALAALARCPEQWHLLHTDPSRVRFAFDEALRFESPVQTFFRTTTRPITIEGVTVPARSKVMLSLGAANRDPRRWGEDADRLDIERDATGHLAFGMGIHQCVGQPIARLEADVLLTTLARRVHRLEPAGEPAIRANNTLRGWRSVPVTLVPT